MRKRFALILAGQLAAATALAQYPGMPVGTLPDAGRTGTTQAGLIGGTSADGSRMLGIRGEYTPAPRIRLFADLDRIVGIPESASGWIAEEHQVYDASFTALALQVGAIWDPPVRLEAGLDLGIRLTLMKPYVLEETWRASEAGGQYRHAADVDMEVDIFGGSLSALVSRSLAEWTVPGLSAYGFAGLHMVSTRVKWKRDGSESGSESSMETDPGLGVGLLYTIDRFSFFAELAHVGDATLAAGARMRF